MLYQSQASSLPGGLLRLLLEEQSNKLAAVKPGAEPTAPFREAVMQPLQSPEAAGSARMVSLKPEQAFAGVPQEGKVVAPVAPKPAGPTATVAPTPGPSISAPASSVSMPSSAAKGVAVKGVSVTGPAIGTTINPVGRVAGASTSGELKPAWSGQTYLNQAPQKASGAQTGVSATLSRLIPAAARVGQYLFGLPPLFLTNLSKTLESIRYPGQQVRKI